MGKATFSVAALSKSLDTPVTALPEYDSPPVVEVAISVQFDELTDFRLIHFGLFYDSLRKRYPRVEDHPALGSIIEFHGQRSAPMTSLTIESVAGRGRSWYVSDDSRQLLQLQSNRFTFNWRLLGDDAKYPGYVALREQFRLEYSALLEFVNFHRLGQISPLQCELTYVNHLVHGKGWTERHELSEILGAWAGSQEDSILPAPDDVQLGWQYRLADKGRPSGSLNVQLHSAIRMSDSVPVFVFQLVGRGTPRNQSLEGVLELCDTAHEWIVTGFTNLTTSRMHKVWGRTK